MAGRSKRSVLPAPKQQVRGWTVGVCSLIGSRSYQEDSWLATKECAVVADGMGGHTGGGAASAAAVQIFHRCADLGVFAEQLASPRFQASVRVPQTSNIPFPTQGGTTVVGVTLKGSTVQFFSAGDSQAWLLLPGEEDKPRLAYSAPVEGVGNTLSHYWGWGKQSLVASPSFALVGPAVVILASDGVDFAVPGLRARQQDEYFSREEKNLPTIPPEEEALFAAIWVHRRSPQAIAESLAQSAVKAGRDRADNTTVMVLTYAH